MTDDAKIPAKMPPIKPAPKDKPIPKGVLDKQAAVMAKVEPVAGEVPPLWHAPPFKVQGKPVGSKNVDEALAVTKSGILTNQNGDITFTSDYLNPALSLPPIPNLSSGSNPVDVLEAFMLGISGTQGLAKETSEALTKMKQFTEELVVVGKTLPKEVVSGMSIGDGKVSSKADKFVFTGMDLATGPDFSAIAEATIQTDKIKIKASNNKPPPMTLEEKTAEMLAFFQIMGQLGLAIEAMNFDIPADKFPAARVDITLQAWDSETATALMKAATMYKQGIK